MKVKIKKYPKRRWYHRFFNINEGEQKVKVRVDHYDLWNLDATLSSIILPTLKEYRKNLSGAPHVENEDVPDSLRQTVEEEAAYKKFYETDGKWFLRWKYALDEMIFAFESDLIDWEDQFWIREPVLNYEATSASGSIKYKDSGKFDRDGYREYERRIANGRRLFSKYYNNLWT